MTAPGQNPENLQASKCCPLFPPTADIVERGELGSRVPEAVAPQRTPGPAPIYRRAAYG